MQVIAIFGEKHLSVSCRGAVSAAALIFKASRQYVNELFKAEKQKPTIKVRHIKTLAHNTLLDGKDKVADVLNDGEHVSVIFEEAPKNSAEGRTKPPVSNKKRCADDLSPPDQPDGASKKSKYNKKSATGKIASRPRFELPRGYLEIPGFVRPDFTPKPGEFDQARQFLRELRDGGRDPAETIRHWAKTDPDILLEMSFVGVYAFTTVDPTLTPAQVHLWQKKAGYYYDGIWSREEAEE